MTMIIRELRLSEGFVEENTVGINVSPLINDYENGDSINHHLTMDS